MSKIRRVASAALLASTLALAGCAYDDYGYGGVNVGYGSGGYYEPYGYGYAPYGWYDGYYYPGNGYWLYDRRGDRHRWNDRQRRYWERRHEQSGKWDGPRTREWNPQMREERRRVSRDTPRGGERRWQGRAEQGEVQRQPRAVVRESRPQSPVSRERTITRIPRQQQ